MFKSFSRKFSDEVENGDATTKSQKMAKKNILYIYDTG